MSIGEILGSRPALTIFIYDGGYLILCIIIIVYHVNCHYEEGESKCLCKSPLFIRNPSYSLFANNLTLCNII